MRGEPQTRRAFFYTVGTLGLTGCGRPAATGSPEALSRLCKYSRQHGLGISILTNAEIYTRFLCNPTSTIAGTIPFFNPLNKSGMLADWGRAVVIEGGEDLRAVGMAGNEIGDIVTSVGVEACVLRGTRDLLFWGQERSLAQDEAARGRATMLPYGIHLADLPTGKVRTISAFDVSSRTGLPRVAASFVGGASQIRLSVGYDTSLVGFDGKLLAKEPWRMELVEGSPDGKFLAGLRPGGSLAVIETSSGKASDLPLVPLGRIRWDPTSRYVLAVCRSRFWLPVGEVVVVDAVTQDLVRLPPIVPDNRYHPYEWVLLPDTAATAAG